MENRTIRKMEKCVENVDEILKGGAGSGKKGHTTARKYDPKKDPSSKRDRPGKVSDKEEVMQDLMYKINEENYKPTSKEKKFIADMRGA